MYTREIEFHSNFFRETVNMKIFDFEEVSAFKLI
jgi:hypothetical protein